MLNISSIEDALYQWVYGVAGLQAIFAHPNAPRPTTQYALINIPVTTPQGIEERKETLLVDNSIDIDYSNLEELLVSINTYYGGDIGAFQLATKLKDSLGRVTVTDQLFAAGLGYISASSVTDTPEEIDKRWEERARFDCQFYTRSLDTENIETIQKVELTNEMDGSTVIIEKST